MEQCSARSLRKCFSSIALAALAQLHTSEQRLPQIPHVVEVATAMQQNIDSILDAAEQQEASDVFLQEDEVPRLKINEQIIVQGEKRYWLHISLGRDLKINLDGTQSNTVDVLGTQLEEVIE
jgi:hypothetical protein